MMFSDRLADYTPRRREDMIQALAQALSLHDDILFAFVHGSFLRDLPFHDLDVAVFLSGNTRQDRVLRVLELGRILTDAVRAVEPGGIPMDVRAISDASVGFCYHVSRGRLVAVRNEEFMSEWLADIASRYLDAQPLRDRALKEAMAA